MKYTVYLRTNLVNGKQYVGQTSNMKQRERQWRNLTTYYANAELTKDRDKYGIENFKFEILVETKTREEAWEFEKKYIDEKNTLHPNGYNKTTGGGKGYKFQEEIAKQRSKSGEKSYWFGKKFSDEHKQKIANKNRGKKRSDEFKKHMSEITKGEKNHSFGTKHTDEWKEHMSKIMTGRKMSEEAIEKTAKSKWKPVIQINEHGEIKRYECLKECAEYGYSRTKISECCRRKYLREGNNVYKKSEWYFEEDYEKMKNGEVITPPIII